MLRGLKGTPDARFELATNGLTVHCSTTELIRNGAAIVRKWPFYAQVD